MFLVMELSNPNPDPDPDPDPDPNPLGARVPGDGALFERRPAERRHRPGQHRQGPTKVDFAGAGLAVILGRTIYTLL